jgi:hypothetical protein
MLISSDLKIINSLKCSFEPSINLIIPLKYAAFGGCSSKERF